MTTTTVYLIRHAQSQPSIEIQDPQWPLSARGREQAKALSLLLEPLGIAELWSSPYRRCLKTVAPFARHTGLRVLSHEGLHERDISGGIVANFTEIWNRSWADFDYALPNRESSRAAQRRFVNAFCEVLDRSEATTLGICAHGNVIGLLLNRIDPAYGRAESEALTNPDVLRILATDGKLHWDRSFQLPGLAGLATDHSDTPIQRA